MQSAFDRFCAAFGRRVREVRLKKRLTQEEAAEQGGLALRHYQRVEAGRSVTLWTIWNLSKALGVPPGELFPKKESGARPREPKRST